MELLTERVVRRFLAKEAPKDKIPGGLADKGPPEGVDPKQVEKGMKVEREHTDDPAIAREIAYDHLTEDPRYYDKLEKMEKEALDQTGEALVPIVDQTSGYCGPASLKAVLAYYGIEATEEELAKLVGATREDGVEADGLVQGAQALGLDAWYKDEASFADVERLVDAGIPVIVDWFSETDGHYSVVVNVEPDGITFMDPETANYRTLDRESFLRVWFDFDGDVPEPGNIIVQRIIVVMPPGDVSL
jgi:predicted double-glycine peptidase